MAPAMWVSERGEARVFLFGDNPGARNDSWLTDDLRAAVGASDEVWGEVPDDGDIAAHPLVAELGLSTDAPLSERLGVWRNVRFREVSRSVALDPAGLEGLRPWLAAQLLDGAGLAAAGIDPSDGVGRVIASLAHQRGIPLRWEFSVEGVIRLLGELPEEAELGYFDMILDRVERGPAGIDHEFAAWAEGDLSVAEALERWGRARSPDLHERMGASRNAAWIRRIELMLERPSTRFVFVGLLHLVGDTGVPALLERRGLAVRRA